MLILPNGIAVIEGDTHISKWVIEHGRLDHDIGLLELLKSFVPDGGVVVDAGAYIGDHTCWYLKQVGSSGTVIAFEPNREPYQCLLHNCPKAVSFQCALNYSGVAISGMFKEPGNIGASRLIRLDTKVNDVVACISLDAFYLNRLDLFKLDVEGMEVAAITGAARTIKKCRPVIFTEFNGGRLHFNDESPESLDELIRSFDYTLHWRSEGDLQWDAIYVPNQTSH